jgi:hypothetical protein
MSLFATVAIVCTMATCNNYFADVSGVETDAIDNTSLVQAELDYAMQYETAMIDFLDRYQIGETVFEIVSIDIETQEIHGDDLP